MIRKVNLLVSAIALLAITLYVVVLNRGTTTVFYSWSNSVEMSLGVLVILVFVAGFVLAALIGMLYGFRAYLRERAYETKARQQTQFFTQFVEARSLTVTGEAQRARAAWEQLLRKDPTKVVARIEISKLLEAEGNIEAALRTIDEARIEAPENLEVMFRAAELYRRRGNNLAALDNLALICDRHPNKQALELARQCALDLGKFQDAVAFQQALEDLRGQSDEIRAARATIERRFLVDQTGNASDFRQKLEAHLKRYPFDYEGRALLASHYANSGEIDSAVQSYMKAGEQSGVVSYYEHALQLLGRAPDKALALARTVVREAPKERLLEAQLLLLRVYLDVNLLSDARALLVEIDGQKGLESATADPALRLRASALRAVLFIRAGDTALASNVLLAAENSSAVDNHSLTSSNEGPRPYLSTP